RYRTATPVNSSRGFAAPTYPHHRTHRVRSACHASGVCCRMLRLLSQTTGRSPTTEFRRPGRAREHQGRGHGAHERVGEARPGGFPGAALLPFAVRRQPSLRVRGR
ncbi:unnamed protein product, partial [Ixodes pacificus]